ncbi:MarR family winged helix-turn-helix transcriptional regulator [Oribacterium sp. NK2B42]|uniref:MarR family winged helix-turn-helix transcriptional regulator n=1 Tax=Oribacterium sp. NK2B42 TaxID=689781 RepID=UPI0003FDDDAC|nr:MarR family winged helix-turn-helix transcriptional regulator [Oribacterium sp. NK2B42]MBO5598998.1 winged helix-turn-helix transcriptional regulator [Oribacterium sp.]MBO6310535.1 winged helix-turn-helix transcriptional regulator [Oribacterium sp.]MBP3803318.1 winged helix-turn-helix transcriptional regulator [Oribacterium sp.]MBR1855609.1 winged helix-turn-helix transcriptional regulator [Oribacterium sp.]MCR5007862.1 MarR family winged helix-turn-helix transcriptional regulator [Oribacte
MLSKTVEELYNRFRVHFYIQVFSKGNTLDDNLTSVEAFSLECIKALGEPTVAEFAKMMGISAPNAAYKVNALVQKGYIEKVQSQSDHREYFLRTTSKLNEYNKNSYEFLKKLVERCESRFSKEDIEKFDNMLGTIIEEMVPEVDPSHFKKSDRK